jgi:hypothetical protein
MPRLRAALSLDANAMNTQAYGTTNAIAQTSSEPCGCGCHRGGSLLRPRRHRVARVSLMRIPSMPVTLEIFTDYV